MKKKLIGIGVLLLIVAMGIIGTLAVFNDTVTKKAVITTGKVKIELIEKDGEGQAYVDPTEPIVPGDSISRVVAVKNTGNKPAWIRVKVDKAITPSAATLAATDLDLVKVEIQTGWTLKDGYYYYSTPVQPAEETTALFNEVTLDLLADNSFSSKEFSVDVVADGVQSDNNGATVAEAIGWPN